MTKPVSFNRFKKYQQAEKTRSGLEDRILRELREANVPYEYEKHKIPYVIEHSYLPDLVLPNFLVIELKGLFEADDRRKHLAIRAKFPDLDIRFVFQKSSKLLRKGAKSSYADWCHKHEFLLADTHIPESWINEPINKYNQRILEEIRKQNGV